MTRTWAWKSLLGVVAVFASDGCEPTERTCGCEETRSDKSACTDGDALCTFTQITEFPASGGPNRTITFEGDPASCSLLALRDRTVGWLSLTRRQIGEGVEAPGRYEDFVEIHEDGSFRAYVYGDDDGNSYRGIHAGRLRGAAFFDECSTNDDTLHCVFDYAEPGSVVFTDCR